jgi:ribonuclease HII
MPFPFSVGIDEAGRGCVIGPLVVAIVAANERDRRQFAVWNVRDSKIIPPAERDDLARRIRARCWFAVRVAWPAQIDEAVRDRTRTLNGLETELMVDLLRQYRVEQPDRTRTRVLVDAPSRNALAFSNRLRQMSGWDSADGFLAMHHADTLHRSVGAASIVAKDERERLLTQIKQELRVDIGCGYPHDPLTIAHLQTVAPNAPHVRWCWATAERVRSSKNSALPDHEWTGER